jgi:hypothetical protein
MFLQWFECPSCGHSRQGAMMKADVAPDRRRMRLLFLCERCESVSTLKRPGLNAVVLLVAGVPFVFALGLYAGVGAAVIAGVAVMALGPITQKYLPVEKAAA